MFPLLYHAHHSRHTEDLPFWQSLAAAASRPILELGCGTGRVLIPLAQATAQPLFGLDYDFAMLTFLRQNLPASLQTRIHLIQADFTCFRLAQKFGLILMPCNTFSTVNAEDRLAALRCVHRHLLPGSLFAASLPNPALMSRLPDHSPAQVEETFPHPLTHQPVQVSSAWQRSMQYFNITWSYEYQEDHLQTTIQHSLEPIEAYQDTLRKAGFIHIYIFGNYDQSRYRISSPYAILMATRE